MKRLLPFRADFEDDDVGARPSALTELATHDEYETFEVQACDGDGSKAVRMVNDPLAIGGTENKWSAMCATDEFAGRPTRFEWTWSKTHEFDPHNYDDLRAYGPTAVVLGNDGAHLVSVQYGTREHYLSGAEFPHGVAIGKRDPVYRPTVAPAGEFARFEVDLDTDAETFDLRVDGEDLGTFDWQTGGTPARLAFETGGWGITGDSKVGTITVTGEG